MKQGVRVLLPWLDRREALVALLGFRLPLAHEEVSALSALYDVQVAARRARLPFDLPPPDLEPLPDSLAERGEAFLASLSSSLVKERNLRVGIIDLSQVLSFQKVVAVEAAEKRVQGVTQDDWQSLVDLCLPVVRAGEQIQGVFDKDGGGLTISSDNPNLRVSPVQQVKRGPNGGEELIGFNVTFGMAHVQVTRYQDRCYLKDGYHRSYGLLARGIRRIPCVLSDSLTFADVMGAAAAAFIAQEHLTGPHPPRVSDFLDPNLSALTQQQMFRKVVRIRAEEFVVNL